MNMLRLGLAGDHVKQPECTEQIAAATTEYMRNSHTSAAAAAESHIRHLHGGIKQGNPIMSYFKQITL